jgi:hypothetical protein
MSLSNIQKFKWVELKSLPPNIQSFTKGQQARSIKGTVQQDGSGLKWSHLIDRYLLIKVAQRFFS